ncbi:Oxidoreductase-like domain-containing protein, partial [Pleurotus pulmonarius]
MSICVTLRWNSTGPPAGLSLDEVTERIKRPTRGGQNLSLRYVRLERSLRGKEGFQKELNELVWASEAQSRPPASTKPSGDGSFMFRGFFVPEKPRPPEADECCMSGCAVCVYDLYEDSLSAYKDSIAALRSSLEERGIPETEWPAPVRRTGTPVPTKNNVALSAFEEFEQA